MGHIAAKDNETGDGRYIAPEALCFGSRLITGSCDIWSLGYVFLYLFFELKNVYSSVHHSTATIVHALSI